MDTLSYILTSIEYIDFDLLAFINNVLLKWFIRLTGLLFDCLKAAIVVIAVTACTLSEME